MASYHAVLRGTARLSQEDRRNLSKTNAAIARVLDRDEREPVRLHLFAHGLQCSRKPPGDDKVGDTGSQAGTRDASRASTADRRRSSEGSNSSNNTSTEKDKAEEGSGWKTPWRRKKKNQTVEQELGMPTASVVFADVNIFNILLAGANGRCFVFLARESQPGARDDGDHTVYVFECSDPLVAAEMAEKVNKESRAFMKKLKEARTDAAAQDLHDASAEAFRSEKLAFEQETSYLSQDLDNLQPDEFEKLSFTGFVEETPMSPTGRPSVMLNGALHEVRRASRRKSEQYLPATALGDRR